MDEKHASMSATWMSSQPAMSSVKLALNGLDEVVFFIFFHPSMCRFVEAMPEIESGWMTSGFLSS